MSLPEPAIDSGLDWAARMMRLLQFCDSAFPVGTFSFSNGLETAASTGRVHDAATLEAFARVALRQSAYSDGIVALHAHRAALNNDYAAICEADRQLMLGKANAESRLMLQRMGKKMAELCNEIFADALTVRWTEDIESGKVPGSYPVAQALAFACAGLSEEALFCAQRYGLLSMLLGAALRCVRVSHYDTQHILGRLGEESGATYREISALGYEDIHVFTPQMDLWASLHEKGLMRMFMN